MSVVMGKSGSVSISTTPIAYVDSFTLNIGADLVEITAYGSSFKERSPALKDWSGSFTGKLQYSAGQATLLDQFKSGGTVANVALRFNTSGGYSWRGNALISGMPITSNVNGAVTWTANFQGNGALTYSNT